MAAIPNNQQLHVMVNTMNEQIKRLNQLLEESRNETINVRMMAEQTREALRMSGPPGGGSDRKMNIIRLIDQKSAFPEIFRDDKALFSGWTNRVIAFCDGMYPGMRKLMKWVVEQKDPLGADDIENLEWEYATEADGALYNMLQQITDGMAQATVTCASGDCSGFEAWRKLCARFDPQSAMSTLDRVRQLSNVQRVKSIDEVMIAVEKWEKKFAEYVEKT